MHKKAALLQSMKLRPHQENAIDKYLQNDNQQILAHSLGSGKTITSLGAVERSNSKSTLVLTPAALQKNYKDSIESYVTPDARGKYHVMSYEKFRMNPDKFIDEINPDTLVVDEYHRQKDPKGVSYNALKRVRPRIKNFIGLTGTVMQNDPTEIFPLVNLAKGDLDSINPSREDFESHFTEKKRVYPKGIIKGLYARLMGRYGEKRVLKNTDELKKILAPLVDKNEPTEEFMSNFPTKEFVDIETPMSGKQKRIYDYFMKKDLGWMDRWRVKHDLPPKAKGSSKMFAKLIHAREVANSPIPLSEDLKGSDPLESSAKLKSAYENLKKHLDSDPVNKAMIYSNFTASGLNPYTEVLRKSGIPYGEFSGQVTKKNKNNDVTEFNSNKKRVLMVSPSGAEGLDLKGVTLLQNLDPHWNPAKMNQVYGRAARFKSHAALPPEKRKVRIERYKSTIKPGFFGRLMGKKKENTIDQYIYNRAKEKEELVDQVNDII
jgi:SNF2 family DNA or RNA helicase